MADATLLLKKDDRIDIDGNYAEFCQLLRETKREGIEEFITNLESTDLKIAPASTKFHLNIKGGLVQHSLNVCEYAYALNRLIRANLSNDSITISALLHDFAKISFYKIGKEWDKQYKNETGQWREKEVYVIDDLLPLVHGHKSVIVAQNLGLKLLPEEEIAIAWHMGFSSEESKTLQFKQAWSNSVLLNIISMSDQLSDTFETHIFIKEEVL